MNFREIILSITAGLVILFATIRKTLSSSIVFLVIVFTGLYYYRTTQNKTLTEIAELRKSLQRIQTKETPKAIPEATGPMARPFNQENSSSSNWLRIQKQVTDTVVQVFANVLEQNLLEPYKTPKQGEGTGSGFFINNKGDFITNYHVVAQASNIEIQIPSFGMERFDVEITGVCPDRDIALLHLSKQAQEKIGKRMKTIPFLELGDSDQILRSQEVLALGYPLGQSKLKSTLGIVSGRERLGYFGYIQITAPLNHGSSGGPALNPQGQVVGINSRGIIEAQNVGYIIPINEVKSALDDLYAVKLLRKPTLGCIFTMATPEMVKYLNNPPEGGWYVAKVFDNTLLKSVGIQAEDMLYEVNGYKIDMYGELNVPWSEDKASMFELLNRHKVGDTLNFVIYRKGIRKEFTFKLEHKFLPAIRTIYPEFETEFMDYEVLGGMVVMPLTLNHVGMFLSRIPELVKYGQAEYQQDPSLIVTHVLPNSQAYKARVIRAGELIDKINDIKVRTMKDLREAVKLSKKTGYITLCTTNNLYAVLPVDKILEDEQKLSSLYFYKPSSLLDYLK